MKPVRECRLRLDDLATWQEIQQAGEPVLLRGLVTHWPLTRCPDALTLAQTLASADNGQPVDAVLMPPEVDGALGYGPGLQGFNFVRNCLPLSQVLEQILRYARFDRAPAVAVQSAPLRDCLPALLPDCRLPLLHADIAPRLWLGTAMCTPAHFDESRNLACVVAGRRVFRLLPPEQVVTLSVGPLDGAPTGTPISLASLRRPDLQRFPALAQALPHMQVAELGPGDALYLPPLWWHEVESLDRFNLMLNHWWHGDALAPETHPVSGLQALWAAALSFRHLPEAQRQQWQQLFAHFVFGPTEAAVAHLPPERRGLLEAPDGAARQRLLRELKLS